jgi:hypothetical protein
VKYADVETQGDYEQLTLVGSVGGDCLIPRFLWDQYGPEEITGENGEGFS